MVCMGDSVDYMLVLSNINLLAVTFHGVNTISKQNVMVGIGVMFSD